MPYKILYKPKVPPKGRPWKIYNLEKKKIVGSSITKEMARKAIRARYMRERR